MMLWCFMSQRLHACVEVACSLKQQTSGLARFMTPAYWLMNPCVHRCLLLNDSMTRLLGTAS
jgi:hypothetical protein